MTRVLVSVAVLEGESPSAGLIELLGTVDVTVLGYHLLPEQTPADQARAQFEERATAALENITAEFRAAGGAADHRLVFTQDRRKTIDRIAAEVDADAYALPGSTGPTERLLVSLPPGVAHDRIGSFISTLVGNREIAVTAVLGDGESLDALSAAGVEAERVVSGDDRVATIADAAAGHDAVVVSESGPSLSALVFGDAADRLNRATVGPVIVLHAPDAPGPA